MFCQKPLGANEVIESFPVGRRLAFDSARGRLWVVCRKCERWNLTPLEERWEAVEDCERIFRDTADPGVHREHRAGAPPGGTDPGACGRAASARVRGLALWGPVRATPAAGDSIRGSRGRGIRRHHDRWRRRRDTQRRNAQPERQLRQPVDERQDAGQASSRRRWGDQAEAPGSSGNPHPPIRLRAGLQGPGPQAEEESLVRGRRSTPLRRRDPAEDQLHGRKKDERCRTLWG